MLKSEVKQSMVLLVFVFLMQDVLSIATIAAVFLGVLSVVLKKRPPLWSRNCLAVGVLLSYWLTYGKMIDPEVGLNFLTTVIVLKLLEKEAKRDHYMIFFGLILLISSGSLFEKTLSYMVFFIISFFVLIRDFYLGLSLGWRPKDFGMALFWIFPLTLVFFLAIPRMMNPIPMQMGRPSQGEVGYTADVLISEVGSLARNDRPVFQAQVNVALSPDDLYWRGNTLSFSDGWNWVLMSEDKSSDSELALLPPPLEKTVSQEIRLQGREDFFFTLDYPLSVTYANTSHQLKGMHTLPQRRWQGASRYKAESVLRGKVKNEEPLTRYLRSSLSKKDKEWINQTFIGLKAHEIEQQVRDFFRTQGFAYSLSPGKISSFNEFMREKKVGFCSHFASSLAQILRTKKIPARLVSGFMGGTYNRFADFYDISQNDAHVWVEALVDGSWRRLDPTEWIAPDRVQLGGEAFMGQMAQGGLYKLSLPALKWVQNVRHWFSQWDFKFYDWLENMDHNKQETWFKELNFKRQWFYFLAPILLGLFMGLYAYHLTVRRRHELGNAHQRLWMRFIYKMRKRDLELPLSSLKEAEIFLMNSDHADRDKVLEALRLLILASFGKEIELNEVRKKIERI